LAEQMPADCRKPPARAVPDGAQAMSGPIRFPPKTFERFHREAIRVYKWARSEGMTHARARILSCGAAYGRQFYTFERTLAEFTGFCRRTVQRAMAEGKKLGLITSKWIKRGTFAPGSKVRMNNGGALRTVVGWGLDDTAAHAARCVRRVNETYRQAALNVRRERDRAERAAAVAEFRSLPPP
jgi:hypothetical protein